MEGSKQEGAGEEKKSKEGEVNWQLEKMKVMFTKEYLVYKMKGSLWSMFDKVAQILFVIVNLSIMLLANYWQISFAMLVMLTCFVSLCIAVSNQLASFRDRELL